MAIVRALIRSKVRSLVRPLIGGEVDAHVLTAPVLDWDDEGSDLTPDFTCTLVDPVVGDTLTIQVYSDVGLTTLVDSDVNVLDAVEVAAEEATFALDALSAGTYYVRVLAERSGWTSAYSNTETIVLSTGPTDGILQEDGTSFYLQEDGTSFYQQESA
jgi:hypothetical protein